MNPTDASRPARGKILDAAFTKVADIAVNSKSMLNPEIKSIWADTNQEYLQSLSAKTI